MELISRADAIKDAESWVAVDEHERHLQKNVIEWLKEFPTAELGTNLAEVGTDCISRQAAIDALEREKIYSTAYKEGYTQTDYFKQYNMGLTDGIKALNKLTSAQPEQQWIPCKERREERKTGEWIMHHEENSFGGVTCSNCGWKTYNKMHSLIGCPYNFCPNCGAEMK